jgi:ankyrin repeat protein
MDVLRAAAAGDLEVVKQWLTVPHTRQSEQVERVLAMAAKYGQIEICQLMLDSGRVSDGDIPFALLAACMFNQKSTAQLLIRHGHINTHDKTEALFAACIHGHTRIVTWLASDVMQLSQSDRIKWLLTTACARGDISDMKQLATQVDSDVTRVMSQALRVACHCGRNDIVKWLTSHTTGKARDRGVFYTMDGEVTSLMVACNKGYDGIVRRLLQCVTPHTVNMMSGKVANTALHFTICCEPDKRIRMQAACTESDIETVTATLYLSNLDLQVAYDYTALHYACVLGDVEIVRMLLSAFANTHITNDDRRTPAMLAEMYGHTEVLSNLQCTLSATTDISALVSANDNNVSTLSVLSVEDVTQHNTPHTTSSRTNASSKSAKRTNMRIV